MSAPNEKPVEFTYQNRTRRMVVLAICAVVMLGSIGYFIFWTATMDPAEEMFWFDFIFSIVCNVLFAAGLILIIWSFFYIKNHAIVFTNERVMVRNLFKIRVFERKDINPELIQHPIKGDIKQAAYKTIFKNRSNKKLFSTTISTPEFCSYINSNFSTVNPYLRVKR